jgi:hypothetical protein
MCVPRDAHAEPFQFVDVDGKGARGRIQQGTAANRTTDNLDNLPGKCKGGWDRIASGNQKFKKFLGFLRFCAGVPAVSRVASAVISERSRDLSEPGLFG